MPAFSRLQLAAALIEYDNDPNDPNPSHRAQDSVIFSRFRTQDPARARKLAGYDQYRQTPNHLGVKLPVNDAANVKMMPPQRPIAGTQSSIGSVDLLRNPFRTDVESEIGVSKDEEQQDSEEEPEVDLEAWGMSNILGKDAFAKSRRREHRQRQLSKANSEILPNPYSPDKLSVGNPYQHLKAKSLGGLGDAAEAFGGPLIASEADFRRRTLSAPLDPAGRITPDFQKPLSQGSPRLLPNRPALQHYPLLPSPNHIPFPTGTITPEPDQEEEPNVFELPLTAPTSRFDPKSARIRTTSRGSRNSLASQSKLELIPEPEQQDNDGDEEVFTPGSDRASRFDVDVVVNKFRPLSLASLGGTVNTFDPMFDFPEGNDQEDSPDQVSNLDIRDARTRTISNVSLGSRLPPENEPEPVEEKADRPASRRFSRLDLLRPKVLIMPGPLQGVGESSTSPPPDVPAGFQFATLGPPLPPGVQTSTPPTLTLTPNPRVSLTLSQLTFRNSLLNDGQRDVTFFDIEKHLRRAEKDGEQIIQEEDIEEEIAQEQKLAHGRPAGKLYGRSLMDELQARKEKLKGKQRVFTGDQRPPMMTRSEVRRSQTLIDPATLRDPPSSGPNQLNTQGQPDVGVDLQRRPSRSKPLLSFDDKPKSPGPYRVTSTFGHDDIWELDMQRRKLIDEAERAEEEAYQRMEAAKAAKIAEKEAKRKVKEVVQPSKAKTVQQVQLTQPQRISVVPDLPPTLPTIPTTATARRAPPAAQGDSDSESDSEASLKAAKLATMNAVKVRTSEDWLSSDDEDVHRPKKVASLPIKAPSDSEEDVPLSNLAGGITPIRAVPTRLNPGQDSDSEDERPLSKVLQRKLSLPKFGFNDFNFDSMIAKKEKEEDNVPLAVRHPRAVTVGVATFAQNRSRNDDDDDDKPLALKQFGSQQMIQQQQQQQQMQYQNFLAQQQMMMMQPSTMSFAGTPFMNGFAPFMMTPQQMQMFAQPAAPPDSSKLQSVDRWRRGVEN